MQFKSILYVTYKMLNEHPEIADQLSSRLHLKYREEKDGEGNVCYLESDEVRPEFREVFTPVDVAHYLCAVVQSTSEIENENFYSNFPYPQNLKEFWRLAKSGEESVQKDSN